MNRSANEYECGPLVFNSVFLPTACFYSEDCFDRVVILFNSRICISKCPVEVNCQ